MKWTSTNTMAFIQLYKRHPVLWDASHPKHYNMEAKLAAWDSISSQMGTTSEECRRRIGGILSGLRRERFKIRKSLMVAAAPGEVYESTWYAFKSLSFLLQKRRPRSKPNRVTPPDPPTKIETDVLPSPEPPKQQTLTLEISPLCQGNQNEPRVTTTPSEEPEETTSIQQVSTLDPPAKIESDPLHIPDPVKQRTLTLEISPLCRGIQNEIWVTTKPLEQRSDTPSPTGEETLDSSANQVVKTEIVRSVKETVKSKVKSSQKDASHTNVQSSKPWRINTRSKLKKNLKAQPVRNLRSQNLKPTKTVFRTQPLTKEEDPKFDQILETLRNSTNVSMTDECSSFGLLVANKLRNYSQSLRSEVQNDIWSVIFKADRSSNRANLNKC